MSWLNYAKSFITSASNSELPLNYRWVSVLILFVDNGKTVLDKGYIFLGDISINSLFHIQFTNFNIIENNILYMYKNGSSKYIESKKIYLHFKFGQSSFPISEQNINYWNNFFSSPTNKIYNSISNDLNIKHIKLVNSPHISSKKRLTPANISHPLFFSKRIYGILMDQVILSDVKIS